MNEFTVIIPFYNGYETIARLINSIPIKFPIILVDDMSDTPLTQEQIDKTWLSTDGSNIKVIRLNKKGYFSGAVNRGIQECDTDVLILNQDVWFEGSEWLDLLEKNQSQYAMIGERIRGAHPSFGASGYIHGTFMFLRRDAIKAVGLLDEKNYPLWGSTAEYQWRVARRNFEVLSLKVVPGLHHERKENERYGSSIQTILERESEKKSLLIRTPPLLSIVVLCYNYSQYLPDCINSLLGGPASLGEMKAQTLQSFEIIIVDDASTDRTPEVAKSIAQIEKGIRYYRLEKNVGTAQSLNYGIKRAVGKYITFLSADDMREFDSLERLVKVCEQNPHSFAYDDVWLFYKHQRIKKWEMKEYDFDELIFKNQIHAGIVFPREAWLEAGGYPAIMNDGREDWAFNIALGIKGWCGIHVKEYGYLYRREGQNRTERNTSNYFREYFLDKIKSLFPRIYGGYRPVACCGKGGSNKKSTNGAVSSMMSMGGSARMAATIGTQGMVKIEYLGKQMSSNWSGDTTNADYIFGVDRPRGWVDRRDVGSLEEKKGFLSKKDRLTGALLFKLANDNSTPQEPIEEAVEVLEQVPQVEMVTVEKHGAVGMSENLGTLSVATQNYPNPTDMNVEEIKRLELPREGWMSVYQAELANRNRKGAVSWLEEKLAA